MLTAGSNCRADAIARSQYARELLSDDLKREAAARHLLWIEGCHERVVEPAPVRLDSRLPARQRARVVQQVHERLKFRPIVLGDAIAQRRQFFRGEEQPWVVSTERQGRQCVESALLPGTPRRPESRESGQELSWLAPHLLRRRHTPRCCRIGHGTNDDLCVASPVSKLSDFQASLAAKSSAKRLVTRQAAQCRDECVLVVGLEEQPVHIVIDQILDVRRPRRNGGPLHRHVLEKLHGRRDTRSGPQPRRRCPRRRCSGRRRHVTRAR